jgi:excisionase family DNA binding protein
MLTKLEVAKLLRCSPRTVDRLRARGRLQAVKPGGKALFRPEDVDRLLARSTERK